MNWRVLMLGLCLLSSAAQAQAPDVTIDSPRRQPARIGLHWLPSTVEGPRPVVIALHGCGGLYAQQGTRLGERYREYAQLFHDAGWHVVMPDSFGGRSVCAEHYDERTVRHEDRRTDVLATLAWLRSRGDVDAARIAIVGWSHGATTALNAINARRTVHATGVAGVAAFYPGCKDLVMWPYGIAAPVLLQVGAKDDWTPPTHCRQLAEVAARSSPDRYMLLVEHADGHHGFDSRRPVRFRPDVADGKGAHAGGNPAARQASMAALMDFLKQVLQ